MIQTLIVSLSFFGMGVVVYLGTNNVRRAKAAHGGERRLNLSYAAARFGIVIVVSLITEAIYKAPSLPFDFRVAAYTIGLFLFVFGYLGIAIEGRRGANARAERDIRGPDDPRDERDPRRRGDTRDERDPRLPGDPRDPRDLE